ncbi:hypothetical protein AVEN_146173-1 [Araneus ventricosus]|uniref:Uncharacterized protein n=1 Tax=Araneus ventricosus TaxID=182803 RepID=A0A4Y2CIV9_ARAVE|nr:hypothetical protein AVEN_146173-1 [Araneus ventricosus]
MHRATRHVPFKPLQKLLDNSIVRAGVVTNEDNSRSQEARRRRRKVCQDIDALVVFHKPTFCLMKVNNTTEFALEWSINSKGLVHLSTAQIKLASWRRQ